MNIVVPSNLKPLSAINFANYISKCDNDSVFIYDFKDMQNCHPFGLLVVASAIRNNIKRYPQAQHQGINCAQTQGCKFAATFGFFQSIGFDIGDVKDETDGGYRYVPIKNITSDYLHSRYTDTTLLNEKVERQAGLLSDTLVGDQPKNVREAVQYSFREMMRNVFEHARTYELWVCGQYWPSRNEAEIAILDEGIGILKSLQTNSRIHATTCAEANNLALQPGLSRTIGMKQNPYDKWQNSGYGLYVSSTLCAVNGGYFILSSGDSTIFVSNKGQTEYSSSQSGTAICLNIKTNGTKLRNFDSTLKAIVNEGEERAQKNGERRILTASKVTTIASMIKHIEDSTHNTVEATIDDAIMDETLIPLNTMVIFEPIRSVKGEIHGTFEFEKKKYNGILLNVTSQNRELYLQNKTPISTIVRKFTKGSYILLEKYKYDKQLKR